MGLTSMDTEKASVRRDTSPLERTAQAILSPAAHLRGLAIVAVTVVLLSACATEIWPPEQSAQPSGEVRELHPISVKLAEPADDEVVVVVNVNFVLGNHTGMFVGPLLSDPAGNYKAARAQDPDWNKQTTLEDYVRFQMDDGVRILIYRFKVEPQDRDTITARVKSFGIGMPLFCAADVDNQIAGVGPFKTLAPVGWISPVGLAERLRPLVDGPAPLGVCERADGVPCKVGFGR
jgi:hypothetical protein